MNILFDLAFLPARRRIAKLRVKKVMAGHRRKTGVDLTLLAYANPINSCAHVVVNPAPRNAAQNPERMIMGVKQHLMCLEKIGTQKKRAAVRELEVRHLQLHPLAADGRPIFTPIELECLAWLKNQRNKRAASAGLLLALPIRFPCARERRNTPIGTVIAKRDQIRVQLFERALLLAGLTRFRLQPARQLIGKCIQFAAPRRNPKLGLDSTRPQIFADRVTRQTGPPRDLPDRKLVS